MNTSLKTLGLCALLSTSFAAVADPLKEIYPHRPFAVEDIKERVERLAEDKAPVMNVFEMEKRQLLNRDTTIRPWGGYYWALNQGQIANTWQDKNYIAFWQMIGWENNVTSWKKRRLEQLPKVMDMSEKELAKLAPSEKYDLLMGDMSFDLTNRVWQFTEDWGNNKKWGFLSSIEIPEGYRLPKSNRLMALWEGICHGWAVAAGVYPRPEKTVEVRLPNGKRLPFYPDDIKALISLFYANSNVQDQVIVEGYRCDDKRPAQDEFGRYVDELPKKEGEAVLPRCADVHPAVWHAALVNITGVQGRSFIAEIDADAVVNNHPVSGYQFNFFHPRTGKAGTLAESVVSLADYKDPFAPNRAPEAVRLVGVELELRFLAWQRPNKDSLTDGPENDKIKTQKMMYDLELDARGNIVGGQWRASKRLHRYSTGNRVGSEENQSGPPRVKQPDFFWVVPKNDKVYVQDLKLERWDGKGQTPASWRPVARSAHAFVYNVTREFGFDEKCTVIPEQEGRPREVPCEFKYPRPQPLINVVNELSRLSRE